MDNKQDHQQEEMPKTMTMSLQMQSHKPILRQSDDSLIERRRSKTENIFMYRPEMVPRPR